MEREVKRDIHVFLIGDEIVHRGLFITKISMNFTASIYTRSCCTYTRNVDMFV